MQRHSHGLQIGIGDRGLAQHLHMPFVHGAEPVAQVTPLCGEPHMDRAAVMHRALLHDIAVLDHLLDVVGDVRPEIAAACGQFADRHLGIPDVKQHHPLHVVDVVNAEPIEFELDEFEEMPVKPARSSQGSRSSYGPRLAKILRRPF